jgi:hypothetical protein
MIAEREQPKALPRINVLGRASVLKQVTGIEPSAYALRVPLVGVILILVDRSLWSVGIRHRTSARLL